MLTNADVENAYRYFLGRRPETEDVVADLQRRCGTFEDLRRAFFASDEFRSQLPVAEARSLSSKPLDWPRIEVEDRVADDVVATMLEHIYANWQLLGITEPHWSVLSDDQFRAARIHENEESFYGSGQFAVDLMNATLQRNGLSPSAFSRCFELGCGLGRLTACLARQHASVVAMDVSPSHLHLAEAKTRAMQLHNIDYRRLSAIEDIAALPPFDLFVSIIVLQHNPPPVIAALLAAVLTKLDPGGVAYFQLSTYHRHYSFGSEAYLAGLTSDGGIEMHVLPQPTLFALIARCGCDLLEIREDFWTGQEDGISNSVLVRKRA